jgi:hypothetical protein
LLLGHLLLKAKIRLQKYIPIMKKIPLFILVNLMFTPFINAQEKTANDKHEQAIYSLIDAYAEARQEKDSLLLQRILMSNVDQLVSSGRWRYGKKEAMAGMLQSSTSNPGTRTLNIEKVRFFNSESGIVDARYEIQNTDGTSKKMWSTFIVVYDQNMWKISAIRNMLPAVSARR